MSARDKFHDIVKNALIKDDWQITNDPLFLKAGGVEFYIDLGAEKLLAAERDGQKIAVEIKSFVNASTITDFHLAIGQFINYRTALRLEQPDRILFLAMPSYTHEMLFSKEFPRVVIEEYKIGLLIYDVKKEIIAQWIP
jgi:hypothetical protein